MENIIKAFAVLDRQYEYHIELIQVFQNLHTWFS